MSRKKIKISSEMIGRQVKVYATTTITNTNTGKIKFMLRSGKIIESVDIGKKYKENVTIPEEAVEMIFEGHCYGDMNVYEVNVGNEPVIKTEKFYPNITENGVEKGYNNITIEYFPTSKQRLYK